MLGLCVGAWAHTLACAPHQAAHSAFAPKTRRGLTVSDAVGFRVFFAGTLLLTLLACAMRSCEPHSWLRSARGEGEACTVMSLHAM